MIAWISGQSGFVGQYLSKLLEDEGIEVFGFNRHDHQDILNYDQVYQSLNTIKPDYIFHLAGQAFVPESFINPKETLEANILGSLNVLEAVRILGLKSRILLAGSGGDDTRSPYAISKLCMKEIGRIYAEAYKMPIVTTRAYNHTGPGRGEEYAESSFAKQIVEIEQGKREFLEHGNLESVKNYTDIRDVVRAYRIAIDMPSAVYNIASKKSVTMQEVLDTLIKNAKVPIQTKIDDNLYRPPEPAKQAICNLPNWQPSHNLEETMISLLENWREKLK